MSISNEKKTIPKLDIRDSDLVIDVTIDNLFSKIVNTIVDNFKSGYL